MSTHEVPADEHGACDGRWLARFHRGDRTLVAGVYQEHFGALAAMLTRLLPAPSDRESLIHGLFCDLLAKQELRQRFVGGNLAAWLTTVARNRAIDLLRRRRLERERANKANRSLYGEEDEVGGEAIEHAVEAHRVIERMRHVLPGKLWSVFEARFVEQLSQRDAAKQIGIGRTTLAYRERRVRALLKEHVLSEPGGRR